MPGIWMTNKLNCGVRIELCNISSQEILRDLLSFTRMVMRLEQVIMISLLQTLLMLLLVVVKVMIYLALPKIGQTVMLIQTLGSFMVVRALTPFIWV